MLFYEVKLLVEPGASSGDIGEACRDAAGAADAAIEVHHATIHARPSTDSSAHHDAAVFVSAENENDLFAFAGILARLHGIPMSNFIELGEYDASLNYKADEGNDELEEDAARDALGADDKFTITDIIDEADE